MKKIILALAFTSIAGCASIQKAYEEQVCNTNGGFQQGMNDARDGKPMDSSFGSGCENGREAALQGYREGYQSGLAHLQSQRPTEINVNFGGAPRKKYFCEIHAFTQTYSAWGATELEAREEAKKQCTKHYNPMHCEDFTCKSS